MPEIIHEKKIFTLFEVTKSIQKTLNERYTSSFWVKAEVSKLNLYNLSGHCYPELVEKKDDKVICQLKATLWRDDYAMINNKFLRILNEPLKDGIKILALVKITFDSSYGLALNILDIDPNFTLGDLEREKQETIKRLIEEGIYGKNKALKFPPLPQRIAIISVETSKGYADFLKVIDNNEWGYKFFHVLFPAILQGEKAIEGITRQLSKIKKVISHFDVVAVVRGGGGDIGLSSYNHYRLAKEIALFPIPVITGIGHATNETVAEMIAHSNAITPTKLGHFLLQKFHDFAVPAQKAEERLIDRSKRLLGEEKNKFNSEVKLFRSTTAKHLASNKHSIMMQTQSLLQHAHFTFKNERQSLMETVEHIRKESNILLSSASQLLKQSVIFVRKESAAMLKTRNTELNNFEKNVVNMSPENVLRRGYSITLLNGKALKSMQQVIRGDILKTVVLDGEITSTVETVNKLNP